MIYRRLLLYSILACLALLFTDCEEDTFGYPNTVTVSADGGSVKVSGRERIRSLSIYDYDADDIHPRPDEDEYIPEEYRRMRYKWLTVENYEVQKQLVFTCQPNESKKKRKLWIDASPGDKFFFITVVQEGKP